MLDASLHNDSSKGSNLRGGITWKLLILDAKRRENWLRLVTREPRKLQNNTIGYGYCWMQLLLSLENYVTYL
jgi:hypothetical protein